MMSERQLHVMIECIERDLDTYTKGIERNTAECVRLNVEISKFYKIMADLRRIKTDCTDEIERIHRVRAGMERTQVVFIEVN